jgi:hypothetical protein
VTGDVSFVWARNGHCYSRHDEPRTWAAARVLCGQAGGDLVSFETGNEALTIYERLQAPIKRPAWIGIHAHALDRRAVWVGGSETMINTTLHGPSLPENAGCGLQREGKLSADHFFPMHWRPTPCQTKAAALCEQPAWIIRPRDNHAYLVLSRPVPFAEARRACERRGAHLATVGDAEEQVFIAAHVFTELWLGATDEVEEGAFRWLTGEPSAFEAFSGNEPDDGLAAACLVMGLDRRWRDRRCDDAYGTICEAE